MRTVDDLIAVLEALSDAQRRDFGLFVEPRALDPKRSGVFLGPHRRSDAEDRALQAFERLGDWTLTDDEQLALSGRSGRPEDDAVEEAKWIEGSIVVGWIATALVEGNHAAVAHLQPAIAWLETATSIDD